MYRRRRSESGWVLVSSSEPIAGYGAWTEALLSAWGFQADASSNPLSALRLLVRSTGADQAKPSVLQLACWTPLQFPRYFIIFISQQDCTSSESVAGVVGPSRRRFSCIHSMEVPWPILLYAACPNQSVQATFHHLCRHALAEVGFNLVRLPINIIFHVDLLQLISQAVKPAA